MKFIDTVRYGLVCSLCLCSSLLVNAQQMKLGANPTSLRPSALLELDSKKQALLLPRIIDTNQIASPVDGMIIFLESDKTFRVRANNYWTRLVPDNAVTAINNDKTPAQSFTVDNTSKPFGFSHPGGGVHTLAIPDASLTTRGFINTAAQSFDGNKAFNAQLKANTFNLTNDAAATVADRILGKNAASGDVTGITPDNTTIKINTGNKLVADNGVAQWNANKLFNVDVSNLTPALNDVLTYNGTKWEAKAASGATGNGYIKNGTTLQSADFNISGYGDIGMDARVGGNVTAGGAVKGSSGSVTSTWGVGTNLTVGGTATLSALNPNGVLFLNASKNVAQSTSIGDFFWDNTKAGLGLGFGATTGAVGNRLEIKSALTTSPKYLSGLRLSNLAAVTAIADLAPVPSRVLTVDNNGDVVLAINPSGSNWLIAGNANPAAGSFLGTTTDNDMILKYNNKELFRGTKGVNAGFTNYAISLFNGASPFNGHPFIVRANGNDVMAFQDKDGNTKWHWNLLSNGLNFVETDQGDYRLFLKQGGNIGVNTNNPVARLDVSGNFKLGVSGTVINNMIKIRAVTSGSKTLTSRRMIFFDIDVSSITTSLDAATATVMVSPLNDMNSSDNSASIIPTIAWARVLDDSTIRVAIVNQGTGSPSLANGTVFNIVVIQ
ncbi:hypothetical protein ECE50_015400 [Chitinophaga sp. Mgbs1]|uniref:Uncharacterized protein n=1 Tax=Chitinophaga solisilvae TaxID=1233460 RepID=A0A433WC65_9BACT|nr:hypothetical protein [Chitinophaga solisilvae]